MTQEPYNDPEDTILFGENHPGGYPIAIKDIVESDIHRLIRVHREGMADVYFHYEPIEGHYVLSPTPEYVRGVFYDLQDPPVGASLAHYEDYHGDMERLNQLTLPQTADEFQHFWPSIAVRLLLEKTVTEGLGEEGTVTVLSFRKNTVRATGCQVVSLHDGTVVIRETPQDPWVVIYHPENEAKDGSI